VRMKMILGRSAANVVRVQSSSPESSLMGVRSP